MDDNLFPIHILWLTALDFTPEIDTKTLSHLPGPTSFSWETFSWPILDDEPKTIFMDETHQLGLSKTRVPLIPLANHHPNPYDPLTITIRHGKIHHRYTFIGFAAQTPIITPRQGAIALWHHAVINLLQIQIWRDLLGPATLEDWWRVKTLVPLVNRKIAGT